MIDKLKLYGFDKNAIIWIKSYLKDRKQIVNVSNQESKAKEINIGTPQQGRRSLSKSGCASYFEAPKVGVQNFNFYNLRLKKWVRSCALCALGSATPVNTYMLI